MKRAVLVMVEKSQEMEQPVIVYFTTHSWKPIEVNTSSFRGWERERRERFFDFLLNLPIKSLTVKKSGSLWEKEGYKPYWLELPDLLGDYIPIYRPSHYFWFNKWILPKVQSLRYKALGKL